jgi:hypothetical protein
MSGRKRFLANDKTVTLVFGRNQELDVNQYLLSTLFEKPKKDNRYPDLSPVGFLVILEYGTNTEPTFQHASYVCEALDVAYELDVIDPRIIKYLFSLLFSSIQTPPMDDLRVSWDVDEPLTQFSEWKARHLLFRAFSFTELFEMRVLHATVFNWVKYIMENKYLIDIKDGWKHLVEVIYPKSEKLSFSWLYEHVCAQRISFEHIDRYCVHLLTCPKCKLVLTEFSEVRTYLEEEHGMRLTENVQLPFIKESDQHKTLVFDFFIKVEKALKNQDWNELSNLFTRKKFLQLMKGVKEEDDE